LAPRCRSEMKYAFLPTIEMIDTSDEN